MEQGRLLGTASAVFGNVALTQRAAFELTQAQGSQGTYAGRLSGTGLFEKTGAGELTLTGKSSEFSGDTHISQGTLSVGANAIVGTANSTLTVKNAATLSGAGTVYGNTVVENGVQVRLTVPGALTLNGNLSLAAGASLNYQVGKPGTQAALGVSGRLIVKGDLDLNGSVLLNPAAGEHGPMGVGYYRLITYTGALSGGWLSKPVLWQDAPNGFDPRLISGSANAIDLFIAGAPSEVQNWEEETMAYGAMEN